MERFRCTQDGWLFGRKLVKQRSRSEIILIPVFFYYYYRDFVCGCFSFLLKILVLCNNNNNNNIRWMHAEGLQREIQIVFFRKGSDRHENPRRRFIRLILNDTQCARFEAPLVVLFSQLPRDTYLSGFKKGGVVCNPCIQ